MPHLVELGGESDAAARHQGVRERVGQLLLQLRRRRAALLVVATQSADALRQLLGELPDEHALEAECGLVVLLALRAALADGSRHQRLIDRGDALAHRFTPMAISATLSCVVIARLASW